MKRSVLLFLAAGLVLGLVVQADGQSGRPTTAQKAPLAQVQLHKMGAITRIQLLRQVNKTVRIEGFYYDGSILSARRSTYKDRPTAPLARMAFRTGSRRAR